MRINRLFLLVILILAANISLFSQSIKIIRSDVDSTRAGFISAGYLFSVDIAIEGLDSVSAASFDLSYNHIDYIQFSDVVHTDFGRGGKTPVVIHNVDSTQKEGHLYIGVISADSLGGRGVDNPIIIRLEFAVSPNAPNGLLTTFRFKRPQAVITKGVIGDLVKDLNSEPQRFIVHGFIEVWPGDADNDGEVTSMDVTQIGRYIGYGSTKHFQMRSFKRRNASTIWNRQQCMAWDSVVVTYADCDGNGDVTITDQLIVALNFYKTHEVKTDTVIIHNPILPKMKETPAEYRYPANYKCKDIYISSDIPTNSIAGTIKWTSTDGTSRVVAVERGDIFDNSNFFQLCDSEENTVHISNMQLSAFRQAKKNGRICRLIIDGNADNINISQDFYGIDENSMFKLMAYSDVKEEVSAFTATYANGKLNIIADNDMLNTARIYDINGAEVAKYSFYNELSEVIAIPAGVYFITMPNAKIQSFIVR